MTRSLFLALFSVLSAAGQSVPSASPFGRANIVQTATAATQVDAATNVYYQEDEVPVIYTKLRYATAIIFPDPEKILTVVAGDKDWWRIEGVDRILYVSPSKAGIATNITVIGQTGSVYEFLLQEITPLPCLPDPQAKAPCHDAPPLNRGVPYVKVTVRLSNTLTQRAAAEMQAVVAAADERIKAANDETRRVKDAAAHAVDEELTRLRTDYPAALNFDYQVALNTKPFNVRAIFADSKFTYIKVDTETSPVFYEIVDGKPSLTSYDYVNGIYIMRKVIDQGYLTLGGAKLPFSRKTR